MSKAGIDIFSTDVPEAEKGVTIPSSRARRAAVAILAVGLVLGLGGFAVLVRSNEPVGTTYYVDCQAGDNRAAGTAVESAWQTPWVYGGESRVLSGDDRLLLKRGCTWGGQETSIIARDTSAGTMAVVASYGDRALPPPTLTNARGVTRCRAGCGPMDWNPTVLLRIIGSYVAVDGLRFMGQADRVETGCESQPVGNHTGVWFQGADGVPGAGNELSGSEATGLTRGVVVSSSVTMTRIHDNSFVANEMMLKLDGTPGTDGGAVGVQLEGSNNEIDHNDFRGQDACSYDYGRDGSAVEIYGAANDNDIHHNTAFDNESFVELGKPEVASPPTGNRVAFNVVVGIDGSGGGQAFLATRGAESRFGPVHSTVVVNNSVYLPGPRGRGIVCRPGCGPEILTVANNAIWADGDGSQPAYAALSCDGLCQESHNLVWSSNGRPVVSIGGDSDPGSALDLNSLVEDPLWVDRDSGDLHLQPTSPAIDAGEPTTDTDFYRGDYAGTPIRAGSRIDIGALESP